uniref:Uncharacterized protein n=1 Tax=Candidatus Kentrum sp. DK TaxID=2126562 RepID=A0A450THE9_9GAMM|nr:MAG: hypothetical protein BECKDK2373B_GA0170837_110111 [Candidatus Kentron sp. DK]VFJ66592.1 MAG: hypothetical protein BECKDK2373C_GA0170839_11513 [Candidatus Kentron sp. DK]
MRNAVDLQMKGETGPIIPEGNRAGETVVFREENAEK